jgi:hypothetical protein
MPRTIPQKLSSWAFVLAVPDLDGAAGYYRDARRAGGGPFEDWEAMQ